MQEFLADIAWRNLPNGVKRGSWESARTPSLGQEEEPRKATRSKSKPWRKLRTLGTREGTAVYRPTGLWPQGEIPGILRQAEIWAPKGILLGPRPRGHNWAPFEILTNSGEREIHHFKSDNIARKEGASWEIITMWGERGTHCGDKRYLRHGGNTYKRPAGRRETPRDYCSEAMRGEQKTHGYPSFGQPTHMLRGGRGQKNTHLLLYFSNDKGGGRTKTTE